jgi:hypothetical protein
MFKVAFKDVSTKNSEPTYWTILFVMLKIYFIYKVAGKKFQKGYIKLNYVVCLSDTGSSCHVTVMGSLIVLVDKRADWNVPVSYIKYMSPCSAWGFSTKKTSKVNTILKVVIFKHSVILFRCSMICRWPEPWNFKNGFRSSRPQDKSPTFQVNSPTVRDNSPTHQDL